MFYVWRNLRHYLSTTLLSQIWTDFCGECLRYLLFARITRQIAKILPKTVTTSQNPRWPMSRGANVKYTDGQLIGVRHTHTWPKGHVSHFGSRFYPGSHAFILKFDYTGCMSFSDPFGIVCNHHETNWQSQDTSRTSNFKILGASRHDPHVCLEGIFSHHMYRTYCTYLLPLPSEQAPKYCTVRV